MNKPRTLASCSRAIATRIQSETHWRETRTLFAHHAPARVPTPSDCLAQGRNRHPEPVREETQVALFRQPTRPPIPSNGRFARVFAFLSSMALALPVPRWPISPQEASMIRSTQSYRGVYLAACLPCTAGDLARPGHRRSHVIPVGATFFTRGDRASESVTKPRRRLLTTSTYRASKASRRLARHRAGLQVGGLHQH